MAVCAVSPGRGAQGALKGGRGSECGARLQEGAQAACRRGRWSGRRTEVRDREVRFLGRARRESQLPTHCPGDLQPGAQHLLP